MSDAAPRQAVIVAALAMNERGINQGRSGNVSARAGGGMLITPTGLAYEDLRPEDIVAMDLAGDFAGPRRPSSEWRFHAAIYAHRPEAGAVIHTHAPFATALACQGMGIPAFHYMVAAAGGRDIRCAPYALFGTEALSDHALAALDGRFACLLAHHGMIAMGRDLDAALDLACEVEALAAQYWRACQLGPPPLLSDEQMDAVLEKFKTYGQQPDSGAAKT